MISQSCHTPLSRKGVEVVQIYGIADPRNGALFYVGATTRGLARRLNGHLVEARRGINDAKGDLIREILADGVRPEIFEIEAATQSQWTDSEMFWIAHFRGMGATLTNRSVGGWGCRGVSPTEDTRRRIALGNAGKKMSAESIAQSVAAQNAARATRKPWTSSGKPRKAGTGQSHPFKKPVLVDGIRFPSIKAAARALNTSPVEIRRRIRAGFVQLA